MIHVDAINGTDTQSCVEGIIPCATINMALNGSQHQYIIDNTTHLIVYISSGHYTLQHGDFNNITGTGNVSIIGSSGTIVQCEPGAGLYLTSLYSVTIESIAFIGCGYSNEIAVFDTYYQQNLLYASPSALIFIMCDSLVVQNITISNSNGSGIILMESLQAYIAGSLIHSGYYYNSYNESIAVGGIVHLSSDPAYDVYRNYSLFITNTIKH